MFNFPYFVPEKATKFILDHKDPYVKLAHKRDILGMKFDDSEFLDYQNELLNEKKFIRLMEKQLVSGAWEPPEVEDVYTPLQKSTIWTLILLGQIGFNGLIIPNIQKAVKYLFETQYDHELTNFHNHSENWGGFMQSHNSTILRALLRLGFQDNQAVENASFAHLDLIHGKEGFCDYKKGDTRCAWGLIKNLLFFNEWPKKWRNSKYHDSVKASQDFLLSYDLSKADYPRERPNPNYKWVNFSYFKTYHSDIFEGLESLVYSGISSHEIVDKTLNVIGHLCVNQETWLCELTNNMKIKLEKKGVESPWLSLRGLKIYNKITE